MKPQLDGIAAISDRLTLSRTIGGSLRADVDPLNNTNFATENLFGVWITQGLEDPSHNVPYLLQGGLGMPDRDYYLSKDPHISDVRKQYQSHVAALLKLAGVAGADVRAARVLPWRRRSRAFTLHGSNQKLSIPRWRGNAKNFRLKLLASTGQCFWTLLV